MSRLPVPGVEGLAPTGGRGRAQAQGRSTVAPVVSLASSARWASAASESGWTWLTAGRTAPRGPATRRPPAPVDTSRAPRRFTDREPAAAATVEHTAAAAFRGVGEIGHVDVAGARG